MLLPLSAWSLDPDVVHLNHGSYGGCPREVTAAAAAARAALEAAPMRFYVRDWQPALDRARAALASFLAVDAARLVFVPNATTGVAIALGSLAPALAEGDAIVTTDHAYRACRNQLDRLAAARGARVVAVPIALPFEPAQVIAAMADAVARERRIGLALLDHVTSPTALVLPLAELIAPLAARGVPIVVDGAHAPGQLALAVDDLLAAGVTCYAGNLHKWTCAPKGAGFLAVAPAAVATVRPLVTSHGASPEYGPPNRLHAELDWPGTHDPCAYLAVPTGLAAIATAAGDWPTAIAHDHALALALRAQLGGRALAPDAAIGAMAAFPIALPAGLDEDALQRRLLDDGFEVPVVHWPTGPLLRVSAHLYTEPAHADALARELRHLGVSAR